MVEFYPGIGVLAFVAFGVDRLWQVRRRPIPYGPHLCLAAAIVMFLRSPILRAAHHHFFEPAQFWIGEALGVRMG